MEKAVKFNYKLKNNKQWIGNGIKNTKKEIYSHFCNYNNVEKYILLFMSKEDVFEIIKNHCKNYFNDIIISLIHIDVYTILNNFKTIHETLYLKLLSKVKIIDETDTKTDYDSITVAKATQYDIDILNNDITELLNTNKKLQQLKKIVPEFNHQLNK